VAACMAGRGERNAPGRTDRRRSAGAGGGTAQYGDRKARRPPHHRARSADRPGQGHGFGCRGRRAGDGRRVLDLCHRRTHWAHLKPAIAVPRAPRQHGRMSEASKFTVALAQLNPTVGDVAGNAAKARAARKHAAAEGADLVVFPELFISGYPPEDLVLKPAFQAACRSAVEELARETADGGPAMLIGSPWVDGGKLYNACALLDGGRIAAIRFKVNLPNYGVFDEKRVFARGPVSGPVTIR